MNIVRKINSWQPRGPDFFPLGRGEFRCEKLNPPASLKEWFLQKFKISSKISRKFMHI
jgi:hypothetical protein